MRDVFIGAAVTKGTKMRWLGRDMYQRPHPIHGADAPTRAATCHGPDTEVDPRQSRRSFLGAVGACIDRPTES